MDPFEIGGHIEMRDGVGAVEFGSDARLHVAFGPVPWLNRARSKEEGRPIYERVDFIRIQQPGERDCIHRPATELDKRRFREKWRAYEEQREQQDDGTPLAVLFPHMPDLVETLKYYKVFTVEQLAGLSDTQIQSFMGGMKFREAAKQFLAAAEKGKDFHALADRMEKLEAAVDAKDQKIAALEAALAGGGDGEPVRRGPGRPPKQQQVIA